MKKLYLSKYIFFQFFILNLNSDSILCLTPENHDFHYKTYLVIDYRLRCLPNAAVYGNVSLMRQKYLYIYIYIYIHTYLHTFESCADEAFVLPSSF